MDTANRDQLSLLEAAIRLRKAQREYLADPAGQRSNDKGRLVGVAADDLDLAISNASQSEGPGLEDAWEAAFAGHQYGREEKANARYWFTAGFNAASR